MLREQGDGMLHLRCETLTEMIDLLIEVFDSFSKLELCRKEKTRGRQRFRARSRAKTSSAGVDSIFPAL